LSGRRRILGPSWWHDLENRSAPARIVRLFAGRPRTWLAAATGVVASFLLPEQSGAATRLLIAWNCAAVVYIALVGTMMLRSDIDDIRRRAALYDENRWMILLLLVACAAVSFVALTAELANWGGSHWLTQGQRAALAAVTIVLSWSMTHLVFALHYAHVFYGEGEGGDRGGLKLPDGSDPEFADFLYFAFVIGCATATADINITTREMRRVATIHGVVSFVFNTAILALSINIGASLFQNGG
jgi:uncharacterized membrane protein